MRLEPKQEMLDLVPRFEFFREACREFMGNVVGALIHVLGDAVRFVELPQVARPDLRTPP